MKKRMEMLFLSIGFVFSTENYRFVGDNRALRKIGLFTKVEGCDSKLYTSEENLINYYQQWRYLGRDQELRHTGRGTFPHVSNRLPSNLINSSVELVSPPVISHYIFDSSTNEEIVEILNQRVYSIFEKWFWRTKEEISADIPYEGHPLALICKIESEKIRNLRFYSYEFESLPSRKKSNYSVCSYGVDFSDDPFSLLTSLAEGMFGDRKGENDSFEDGSSIGSAYIGKIRDIIMGNLHASKNQMIFALKCESHLEGDKLKMFCKFKDVDNFHIRLILEFIPAYHSGYALDNALMMFPKGREDITSTGFKNIITSIRGLKG